jgi:hypothetical protein
VVLDIKFIKTKKIHVCERKSLRAFFHLSLSYIQLFKKLKSYHSTGVPVSSNMAYFMTNAENPTPSYPAVGLYTEGIPLKRGQQNYIAKLWTPPWAEILAVSMDCEDDEYDTLGRNVSAQERRQELFPWFTVVRSREEVRTDQEN